MEIVAVLPDGAVVRQCISLDGLTCARELHALVQSAARERVGRNVTVQLSADGAVLPADETPVAALRHLRELRCTLSTRPRVLRCEPLWGPEQGQTTVRIHGESFEGVGASARVRFGSVDVPCQRVSSTTLRCQTPAMPAGIVAVSLRRCEDDDAGDDGDAATYEFVKLESAYDAIFATTNSFCPVRGARAEEEEAPIWR